MASCPLPGAGMTSQKGEGSLTGRARASISVLWERQGHTTTLNASRTSRREREVGRAKVALTLFTVLKFSACPLPFLGCTPQPNWAQVGPPHKRQIGIPPVSRPRWVSAPQAPLNCLLQRAEGTSEQVCQAVSVSCMPECPCRPPEHPCQSPVTAGNSWNQSQPQGPARRGSRPDCALGTPAGLLTPISAWALL